jgi:hypothetical protein
MYARRAKVRNQQTATDGEKTKRSNRHGSKIRWTLMNAIRDSIEELFWNLSVSILFICGNNCILLHSRPTILTRLRAIIDEILVWPLQ